MASSWHNGSWHAVLLGACVLTHASCSEGVSPPTPPVDAEARPRPRADAATDAAQDVPDANSCNYTGPRLTPSDFAACSGCNDARCLPASILPKDQSALLIECDDGQGRCVPDAYVATLGNVLLKTCSSLQGVEGRCVSLCVQAVAAQVERLPRDVCGADERCAPCFDPISGDDTGSCHVGCDPGPMAAPEVFERCCHELGACVPSELVPAEQRELLSRGGCKDKAALCTPEAFAAPAGFVPQSCKSVAEAEGRCLPDCVPLIAAQAESLPRSSCAAHELCAPCYDPISGNATGACALSNDEGPQQPPKLFPSCCDGEALCIPKSIVPDAQAALLARDSCNDDSLCVPRQLATDPDAALEACMSWDGAEGRCLSSCLASVAANAERLTRDVCERGALCSPCYDPISGASTGVCEVGDDEPTQPPYTFTECCDGLSLCIPDGLVPEAQRAQLARGECTSKHLCVPKTLIEDAAWVAASCEAIGGAEGRCLPACLPALADYSAQLTRGSCATANVCAPCYDPLTGDDTGACHIGGDPGPQEPKYVFPRCCGSTASNRVGTCVPRALVPAAERTLLGRDSCAESSSLCVPTALARGEYEPKRCRSWRNAEGRCLPSCLPPVAATAAALERDGCGSAELCVPCYDPVSGESTGVCEIEGDAPASTTPVRFPTCCPTNGERRGTCVPRRVAGEAASALPVLDCERRTNDADSYVCAPNEKVRQPNRRFASCTTSCGLSDFACLFAGLLVSGDPGVCVPSCFLSEQSAPVGDDASDLYGSGSCRRNGIDCAPCRDPVSNAVTGLCE